MWYNFVAMGDSITEGVGDACGELKVYSWATYFHAILRQYNPKLRYTNLAHRGLLTTEIHATQLEQAIALRPDLVSIIAGGNDILKGKWNAELYEREMSTMLAQLTATGATVLTSTLLNFVFLPLSTQRKEHLQAQLMEANDIIRQLARQHNALCFEFWNHPLMQDRNMWSTDRIHPNAQGYALIAHVVEEFFLQQTELGTN